jgi:xanthine/uracil permease
VVDKKKWTFKKKIIVSLVVLAIIGVCYYFRKPILEKIKPIFGKIKGTTSHVFQKIKSKFHH